MDHRLRVPAKGIAWNKPSTFLRNFYINLLSAANTLDKIVLLQNIEENYLFVVFSIRKNVMVYMGFDKTCAHHLMKFNHEIIHLIV